MTDKIVKRDEAAIELRKEKSMAIYKARKDAQIKKTADRKEGIAFVHENNITIATVMLSDCSVLSLGRMKIEDDDGSLFAFSLCSPNDKYCLKTAKGLIGKRLIDENPLFTFIIEVNEELGEEVALRAGFSMISLIGLMDDPDLPDRLRRAIQKESIESGWISYDGRD